MNYKTAKYNWQFIADTSKWIYLEDIDWQKLSTSSRSVNIDGRHARIVSNTFARYRIITISGFVDLLNSNSSNWVSFLQKLFALPVQPFLLQENEFQIQDYFSNRWKIKIKVRQPLEFNSEKWWEKWYWKRRVVLESTYSPIFKSIEEKVVSWWETILWWFKLGMKLPKSFNLNQNIITATSFGNIPSPARIVINVKKQLTNLKIINMTTWETFGLNVSASAGDVIEINSDLKTATLNWNNILANRVPGSVWPFIDGETKFAIIDDDGGYLSNDFDVYIYFYDQLL